MNSTEMNPDNSIAVGLGANIASSIGSPVSTLIAVRPQIKRIIYEWIQNDLEANKDFEILDKELEIRWSSLYETKPLGGPKNQPNFINAAGVIGGETLAKIEPCEDAAQRLLKRFLELEISFGRDRKSTMGTYGPRCIDIDLLGWGQLQTNQGELILPHPRVFERDFVIVPLGEALSKNRIGPRKISNQNDWKS